MTSEPIKGVQGRAAARFIGRPGITGVGLGAKVVDGLPTGQLAVTVFVEDKRPRDEVPADQLIPPEFEGVPTDVLVLRDIQLVTEPIGAVYSDDEVDDGRHRPIEGGLRVKGALGGNEAGSIGCILRDKIDAAKVYALTCHHVVAVIARDTDSTGQVEYAVTVAENPTPGQTTFGQPDIRTRSTCCPGIFGTYADGAETPVWDAAVVRLNPGIEYRFDIRGLSVLPGETPGKRSVAVAGIAPMPTPGQVSTHSYLVRKRGMRTGITGGFVVATDCDVVFALRPGEPAGTPERIRATGVVIIAPHPNPQVPADEHPHYLLGGDSGSVSVDSSNRVLGLNALRCTGGAIRRGPADLPTATYFGVVFPIQTVLDQFRARGLDLVVGTATTPGQTHTVPGSTTLTRDVDGERVVVPVPVRSDTLDPVLEDAVAPINADRLAADLEETPGGRELLAFWQAHSVELRRLVNFDRRVAAGWHRSGASAVYQVLLRGLETGSLRIPATVDGQPLAVCIEKIHSALRPSASEPLRRAMDQLRPLAPGLAGLGYAEFLEALSRQAARPAVPSGTGGGRYDT